MEGMVNLTATLVIAPEVDPEFPGAYTRSGLEVSFRPHSEKYTEYPDGKVSTHPKTRSFFSASNLYGQGTKVRCERQCTSGNRVSETQSVFVLHLFKEPCFDVYYHHRQGGRAAELPNRSHTL